MALGDSQLARRTLMLGSEPLNLLTGPLAIVRYAPMATKFRNAAR
jgi:hypothetical protein